MAKRRVAQSIVNTMIIWKIAVYIRLSREDGEDESLSVVNQRKIIDEFVDDYFDDGSSVVDYYIDDGLTGTDYDRPDFQRLMHDIEAGKVNCIIVKTPSRAFRNYADQGYFLENFFPRNQTRFISISSPRVDSYKNPESVSGLELPIMGLMNDRFAGQTSEQVRRTFNTKRRRGEFIGAFAPYGYDKDPLDKNKLIIDETAAQIVRDIFQWFVYDGSSKAGIAKRLNERGIPNPTLHKRSRGLKFNTPKTNVNDGMWNPTTIHRLLQNQMYIGHMVQGKQKVISYKVHDRVSIPEEQWFIKENTHEAIITLELFNQAQDLLKRNTRSLKESTELSLMAGFVRCPDCTKALRRHSSKSHVYYICRTYCDKSKDQCTRHAIREEILMNIVFEAVKSQLLIIEELASLVDKVNKAPVVQTKSKSLEFALESRRKEHDKLKGTIESLYMDYKKEIITLDEYKSLKPRLTMQLEQIAQAITTLETERERLSEGVKTDTPLFTSFLENRNITRLDRAAMVALVDVVFVHEDKRVTIRFKHDDQPKRVYEFLKENGAEIEKPETPEKHV